MSRISYVNGQYVPHAAAVVHVEDRGYQFADGVYEVIAVRQGQLIDLEPHFDRLDRSLTALSIAARMPRSALRVVVQETVRRNRVRTGILYLQVTRGVAKRAHPFPKNTPPALVVTARHLAPPSEKAITEGVAIATMPDIRWGRCDIKAIALLPNVLARQQASEAGLYEAWLVDAGGHVTEGSASNAWIVDGKGRLVTRELGTVLLGGITRAAVLEAARENKIALVERAFTVAEAKAAREAMVTSTTAFVLPVVAIDGHRIGDGRPGPVYARLRALYEAKVAAQLAGRPSAPV